MQLTRWQRFVERGHHYLARRCVVSVAATTAVFFSSLPGPQKLVALALADHADPVGEHIRPSVKRLAVMVTMSERSVQRALKVLVDTGALEVTEPAGRYTPVEYRLTKQVMGDKLTPMTTPWVTESGGHGCQIAPTMGDIAVSPELKKETTTEQKKLTTLSGRPDVSPMNGNGHHKPEIELLDFLNRKAGKHFQPLEANLKLIRARLREATVDQIRAVIGVRCRKWRDDPKMSEYLRPETLFNATKFAQYLGELPATAFMTDVELEALDAMP